MMKLGLIVSTLTVVAAAAITRTQLECSITARKDSRVEIAVRNVSGVPIDGNVYPALKLEPVQVGLGLEYWAPVDLETARPYGPNQPRRLSLRPGQALKVMATPGALFWDRSISSVWPNRALRDVVASGSYVLYLDIEGPGTGKRVESNRLTVTVDTGVVEFRAKRK